jgi:hypothetical protein
VRRAGRRAGIPRRNPTLFADADLQRLGATLDRFLAHVDASAIALTGGVAIELLCQDAGVSSGRARLTDVDFVATSVDAVSASVVADLLVSHFHLPHPGYAKFMVQLVDPETRLRLDVFPDLAGSIARAAERTIAGRRLLVLDAHSILDHKTQSVRQASASRPIDEKHAHDAMVLGALCGRPIVSPPPEVLTQEIYGKDLTPCLRCEVSRTARFAVAPRQRIFEILGYS